MSDSVHSFLVVMEHDLPEDTAASVRDAMCQLRGVIRVVPKVTDIGSLMAEARADNEVRTKLLEIVRTWGK